MTRVVINACYGGFGLSPAATLRLYELGADIATPIDEYWPESSRELYAGNPRFGREHALDEWRKYLASPDDKRLSLFLTVFSPDEKLVLGARDVDRDDPLLIRVIEEMGDKANGRCANLRIVDIPDGVEWEVKEYDGNEWVAEKHRTWS